MSATLQSIATTTMRKHGNEIDKALPAFIKAVRDAKLIDELARWYLQQSLSGVGKASSVVNPRSELPTPRRPIHFGSIKVREHEVRQHRRRTQSEKDAAEAAMLASAEAVFEMQINGRAIGSIAIGELHALKRDLVDDASHKLMLGTEQARNAILAELIEQHCTVQDQLTRVRDAVNAATLDLMLRQAEQEAPRRIAEAMRHAAAALEHDVREIAA